MHDKLIIFDCDGVLVDSEAVYSRVFAEVLTDYGYPITPEESIRKFTGMNMVTTSKMIFQESGVEIPSTLFHDYTPRCMQIFETELLPLTHAILQFLDQNQLARCVASSSPRERVIKCLEITGLLPFFQDEHIFTSQQVKHGKPAPDLFLLAARQLGFAPENCIVIEDSSVGIQAAKAAGMQAIAFLGGGHAKYDWYHSMISQHDIPLAHNESDLKQILLEKLGSPAACCMRK